MESDNSDKQLKPIPSDAFARARLENQLFENAEVGVALENIVFNNTSFNNVSFTKKLSKVHFINTKFHGVSFRNMVSVKFEKCSFRDCMFARDIKQVEFGRCNADTLTFTDITVSKCSFRKSKLAQLIFERSKVDGTALSDSVIYAQAFDRSTFDGCTLTRVKFLKGSKVDDCVFKNFEFEDVQFQNAILRRNSFENGLMEGCTNHQSMIHQTTYAFVSFNKQHTANTEYSQCTLSQCSYTDSSLLKCSFNQCKFITIKFIKGQFSYNILDNAHLTDVRFEYTRSVENSKVKAVLVDTHKIEDSMTYATLFFAKGSVQRTGYTYEVYCYDEAHRSIRCERMVAECRSEATEAIRFKLPRSIAATTTFYEVRPISTSTIAYYLPFSAGDPTFKFSRMVIEHAVFFPDAVKLESGLRVTRLRRVHRTGRRRTLSL